jgi:predicted N-formylglutamate amidohydrolase
MTSDPKHAQEPPRPEPPAAAQAPATSLLAPDEPAPYEIVNAAGAAPLVLLCDHASRFIPRALDNLGLGQAELSRHIAWDIGIADVTRRLAEIMDAPAVLSRFSRLIVDPNRALDDPTLVPRISDGVIVPGNRELAPAEIGRRIAAFHRPYHAAVDRVIEGKLADLRQSGRRPALISMHSFTPVIKGTERPWQIGILWNRDPRIPEPLMARLRAEGIVVGDNEPYSGRDNHGYTLHVHAEPRGLANALIEMRQDLIDTHHGAAEWTRRIRDALRHVLDDPRIYAAWRAP